MSLTHNGQETLDRAYRFLVEEEEVRVCKDIPDEACQEVPGNFFKLGASHTLTKLADELGNAKTVLPWLLTSLGAPAYFVGFLVPIRESGSLLPQLLIASVVRRMPRRKSVWVAGAFLQALALLGMAGAGLTLRGWEAGAAVLGLLALFSLARGLCSVSSKDVTGKTIPKTRRGRLTGFTTSLAGVLTLIVGGLLAGLTPTDPSPELLAAILASGAALWLLASGVFGSIQEEAGATEGGKNAIREAIRRMSLLKTDPAFRRFVLTRALFVSTGLSAPYYVTLAREQNHSGNLLGFFILASGLASALSSAVWGRYSDRSSRRVLVAAALGASLLGLVMFLLDRFGVVQAWNWIPPLAFFLLSIAHSGVRIGRKTYILDLASGQRRTDYVAVSNTIIGVVLLLGGVVGTLASLFGPGGMLLVLSLFGFAGVALGWGLPEAEVQG